MKRRWHLSLGVYQMVLKEVTRRSRGSRMHTSSLYVMGVEKNLEIIPGWMFRPEVEPGPEKCSVQCTQVAAPDPSLGRDPLKKYAQL